LKPVLPPVSLFAIGIYCIAAVSQFVELAEVLEVRQKTGSAP
jgi:hypothetical protein